MIKWIKSLFKKEKTTSELLREGFYEEQEALKLEDEVETPVIEKFVCNTHKTRFKKSCPVCRAAGKW
jgi:hypothetical protein|tara:strand:- start:413 stop:613 length:201 start_codon:yes stop_codon:yes gene_type:complete